jgi:phospholipase/carboxylesterase
LGADEHDLIGLAPELDRRLLVVSLRAPNEYEFGGYAWFDVKWDESGVHADEAGALRSRDLLLRTLSELPLDLGVSPSQLFIGGFSQGAMMSLGVSLSIPEKLSGVIALSGRLLETFVPEKEPDSFAQLPFLVQHGVQDQVVPVIGGREAKTYLEINGGPLTYQEFPMAHEITRESLDGVRLWLEHQIR